MNFSALRAIPSICIIPPRRPSVGRTIFYLREVFFITNGVDKLCAVCVGEQVRCRKKREDDGSVLCIVFLRTPHTLHHLLNVRPFGRRESQQRSRTHSQHRQDRKPAATTMTALGTVEFWDSFHGRVRRRTWVRCDVGIVRAFRFPRDTNRSPRHHHLIMHVTTALRVQDNSHRPSAFTIPTPLGMLLAKRFHDTRARAHARERCVGAYR